MTIPPVIYECFVIYQGADWIEIIGFGTGNTTPPTPVDMTDWEIEFIAKNAENNTIINATTGNGKITFLDDNTKFKIHLIPAETTNYQPGTLNYNLKTTNTSGEIDRRMEGTLTVSAEV